MHCITNIIAGAYVTEDKEHPPNQVVTELTKMENWMFEACQKVANLEGWPKKDGHLRWFDGDTVGTFLDQLDLPR